MSECVCRTPSRDIALRALAPHPVDGLSGLVDGRRRLSVGRSKRGNNRLLFAGEKGVAGAQQQHGVLQVNQNPPHAVPVGCVLHVQVVGGRRKERIALGTGHQRLVQHALDHLLGGHEQVRLKKL